MLAVARHTVHGCAGSAWPPSPHAPANRHAPGFSTLLHPVVASHASFVQDFPSSHPVVAPPTVHSPDRHVFAATHVSPAHDRARHSVPSAVVLQDVVLFPGVQTSHPFAEFAWPFAKHAPPIRQKPGFSVLLHPVKALHVSVVQDSPSSQFANAPAGQSPDWHSLPSVHDSPAHPGILQIVPSSRSLQPSVPRVMSQTLHAFKGFDWPSDLHIPAMRQ